MEREEIIQVVQEEFFVHMLSNSNLKASDRDVSNRFLRYDGFPDFWDDFKNLPLPKFSSLDRLFTSLIEHYFLSQLKPTAKEKQWDEEELHQFIKDAMNGKEQKLIGILKNKYPLLCTEIEQKRDASKIF
jgi:hypothetical protein